MRVMSEEQKRKMAEGREKAKKLRESLDKAMATPLERLQAGEKLTEPERQAAENLLRSQMTRSIKEELNKRWNIVVDVDWNHLPILDAQEAYAVMRKEFEKAGQILNDRSMPAPGSYKCFICQITHPGDPRGKDLAYEDPETKLRVPVEICGEACWLKYSDYRIKERSFRNDMNVGLITPEEYIQKTKDTLAAMRTLQNQKMLKSA